MSARNEILSVILSIAVAATGFLLIVGVNHYVWPKGDCEGTYYLDPKKPFSSPVMEINSSNYANQCGKKVTVPDPNSEVGTTLFGETVYGGSDLSNSGPCREYNKCKAALEVRTLDSVGDIFRLSLLLLILFGVVIGTFFAGGAIVATAKSTSSGSVSFFAISYLAMVAASTAYLVNYYWAIGEADRSRDAFGYPVAVLIGIAGFIIFLFFFFILKKEDAFSLSFYSNDGATGEFVTIQGSAKERFQSQKEKQKVQARQLQQKFYDLIIDYSRPAAKEATIFDGKDLDKLMGFAWTELPEHPHFQKFVESVARKFGGGNDKANLRIVKTLTEAEYPCTDKLLDSLISVCQPDLARDPRFTLRRPMTFWQRIKMPTSRPREFRKIMYENGVIVFEQGSKESVFANVAAYIPGDTLLLYGSGGTLWGVAEIANEEAKRLNDFEELINWADKYKWVREVRWIWPVLDTKAAKKAFGKLKAKGISPPRAFSKGLTAEESKKVKSELGLSESRTGD